MVQLHSYCIFHRRDDRGSQYESQTALIKFEQMAHYLGLYVNYKDTLVLDRMFTCLLRFSEKKKKKKKTQGQWQEWYVYNSSGEVKESLLR